MLPHSIAISSEARRSFPISDRQRRRERVVAAARRRRRLRRKGQAARAAEVVEGRGKLWVISTDYCIQLIFPHITKLGQSFELAFQLTD